MKVLLILPDANMHKFTIFGRLRSAREAPLTLTTLAALGSAVDGIDFHLIDESVDRVPLDFPADLVAISALTGTARRAYALADHFRRRGIPVVLGGVHVTLLPDEAERFADSILTGFAGYAWPRLLRDFKNGELKKVYDGAFPDGPYIEGLPTPRWDLQRHSGYMLPYTVLTTMGCPYSCDFCSVPTVWPRYLRRPIGDVIRDIKQVPKGRFVISDVCPFEDKEYVKELFSALIPLKKKWGGLATARIADDPELFDLMVRSGCEYLLIGFESVNQQALNHIHKGFNKVPDFMNLMKTLHHARIVVQGCFVFGFDEDSGKVFSQTVDYVQQLGVDIPRYSFYTPYPGTALFKRLEAEGRILSRDWGAYDTMHVVFQPKQMSPVELYEGFRWAYRETFRLKNIVKRAIQNPYRAPIVTIGNLTYRKFVRRIHEQKGFEMPLPTNPMLTSSFRIEDEARTNLEL